MTRFERVFSVLTFGTMQTVVSKLISFINFAILVRLLSTEEIGIIGLAGGYMALFGILMILPENIIIREFMTIKKNLNVFMNSFLQFSLARGIFLFLIGIPVAIYIQSLQQDPRLSIYFMLLLGVNLINGLNGPFREAFYGFYRQARITFVDIVVNILLLLTMAFLYFHREVLVYGALQVIVALIGVGWWYWNARSHLDFRWMHQWDIGPAVQAMMRFSLWNHLAGVVIRLVYQIDILILGFFVGLATIGDYAVALTLANVFFIFPQMIQKVFSLTFSDIQTPKELSQVFGIAIRYNTLMAISQLIGYLIMGTFLISLLGPEHPERVFEYSIYIVGGLTIFNIARPWAAMAVSKIPAKDFFFKLFLIPSLMAVPIYYFSAQQFGALGVAQANLITFLILGGWVMLYMHWQLGIRPDISFISESEKKIFREGVACIRGGGHL